MIKQLLNENFDPDISSEIPENVIEFSNEKRIDVIISVMESIRQSILSWTERSYKATSWSVGILLSVVSFWILYGNPVNFRIRGIIATGVFVFGSFTQLYLLAALRAFRGNGSTLVKCEAALSLCSTGSYFKHQPFFGYSGKWLSSKSLSILRLFHFAVLIFSFFIVLFVTPVGKSSANLPQTSQGQTQSATASNAVKQQQTPAVQPALAQPSLIQQIDIGSWTTAIATLILAILTGIYVLLTKKILEAQSDPCVILTVVHDQNRPSILQLVVKNIGNGLAHDISFEFSKPLPNHAWGITTENAKDAEVMKDGPLILGIPALGPGEERKIDWGQYGGLIKNIGEKPITATSFFKNNGKKMKPVKSYLDVKSFEGTNASESPIAKIANHIENISKEVNHISTGFRKPQIRVVEMPSEEKEIDKA